MSVTPTGKLFVNSVRILGNKLSIVSSLTKYNSLFKILLMSFPIALFVISSNPEDSASVSCSIISGVIGWFLFT